MGLGLLGLSEERRLPLSCVCVFSREGVVWWVSPLSSLSVKNAPHTRKLSNFRRHVPYGHDLEGRRRLLLRRIFFVCLRKCGGRGSDDGDRRLLDPIAQKEPITLRVGDEVWRNKGLGTRPDGSKDTISGYLNTVHKSSIKVAPDSHCHMFGHYALRERAAGARHPVAREWSSFWRRDFDVS